MVKCIETYFSVPKIASPEARNHFYIGGWGGESFVTPPTGKSCFVFVFALRACARRDARSVCVSRHVFVPTAAAAAAPAPAPPAAESRY